MIECERRFLIRQRPPLDRNNRQEIAQGYLGKNDPARSADPLRIRQERSFRQGQIVSDTYTLTKKHQLTADQRGVAREETITLSPEEFDLLWPLAPDRVEKTRFRQSLASGLTAEIDQFGGRLTGYEIVEVEFPNETTLEGFQPPAWFGREITQEDWACNAIYATLDRDQLDQLIAGALRLADLRGR